MTDGTYMDVIGVPLEVGTIVAAARANEMEVCEVMLLCSKKIRVKRLGDRGYEWTCYPNNAVVLDTDAVVAHRLRTN